MAGFPRERRVRRSAEIRAILAGGRSFDARDLRLHGLVGADRSAPARAAVVVPRHGRSAVERNRLKRRLRELVRLLVLPAPELAGVALVLRTRRRAYDRTFPELREEVEQVLRQARSTLGSPPREVGEP